MSLCRARIRGHSSEPRAGLSPVLSCSGLWVHPGFFHPDTALCLHPWVHSRDTRASALTLPCLGFYQPCLHWGLTAVFLVVPLTPAAAMGFQSLLLQLSGIPFTNLLFLCGPVLCGLGTIGESAHLPLTCARNSGGAPVPHTSSGCGTASAQVGCGNKSNPVSKSFCDPLCSSKWPRGLPNPSL